MINRFLKLTITNPSIQMLKRLHQSLVFHKNSNKYVELVLMPTPKFSSIKAFSRYTFEKT